ncbi:MAG TPA: tRNA pseudouridine(55) synthase TruB [Terriglobales bacterium]|nr:tRNA pseudouridine(55) synthase TruB [Terriglobales bacterium]
MNGVLVIDKAAGMTSHDVVARVRRLLHERSVGHLGTLDPMATGVLPLLLGRMTRLAQFYSHAEKSYEGEFRFGLATDTYDAEGEPVGEARQADLSLEQVRDAASGFVGRIRQMPPPFSAKKIGGVPAYKLARKKKEVELQPVEVEVRELEILSLSGDRARFRSRVSSGTYLRSIAHELGRTLGIGGHLASLRRTASGEFGVEDARSLEQLEAAAQAGDPEREFVHPRRVLPAFPCVTVADDLAAKVRHGIAVNLPEMSKARFVKVFVGQSELIAIATRIAGTLFHPKVVLAGSQDPVPSP